eukprot:c17020_g1_i2.p1 GENE.c17020_g1_i2~~c17020_g1_i2.p1  ORF type:complete len:319 (+),score=59.67 c17020_g1_i2:210-1166(+)
MCLILSQWLVIIFRWFELGELSGKGGLSVLLGHHRSVVIWILLPLVVTALLTVVIVCTILVHTDSMTTDGDRIANACLLAIALALIVLGIASGYRAHLSLHKLMTNVASSRLDLSTTSLKQRKMKQILISLLVVVPCACAAIVLNASLWDNQASPSILFVSLIMRSAVEITVNSLVVYAVQKDPACLTPIMPHHRLTFNINRSNAKFDQLQSRPISSGVSEAATENALGLIRTHFVQRSDSFASFNVPQMPWLTMFLVDQDTLRKTQSDHGPPRERTMVDVRAISDSIVSKRSSNQSSTPDLTLEFKLTDSSADSAEV